MSSMFVFCGLPRVYIKNQEYFVTIFIIIQINYQYAISDIRQQGDQFVRQYIAHNISIGNIR